MLRELNENEMMMVSGGMHNPPPGSEGDPSLLDPSGSTCEGLPSGTSLPSGSSFGDWQENCNSHFSNGGSLAQWYRGGAGGFISQVPLKLCKDC